MKRVLKFSAPWCGPCLMLQKYLNKILEEGSITSEIIFEEIDIDRAPERAIEYSVRAVPMLIMFEDDKEIKRQIGVISPTKLLEWLNT